MEMGREAVCMCKDGWVITSRIQIGVRYFWWDIGTSVSSSGLVLGPCILLLLLAINPRWIKQHVPIEVTPI